MNNINFIKHLQNIKNQRFALDTLDTQQFNAFYHRLLATFDIVTPSHRLYLIGTQDCHLCHHALYDIERACQYTNTATPIRELELIDSCDSVIDALGAKIPVLLTPQRLLCYPFSVMDVINVLNALNHQSP